MVLGIGTGNPIGVAGGLFHMVNNAIYKSCLFLCGGGVENKTGTSDMDRLGGLAKSMPITFVSCLIAALSISGIPPFNGFFSKWMIYQGIIETGKTGNKLWIIWLVAAMFGSALTLASFMKLIHATFLGQCPNTLTPKNLNTLKPKHLNEVSWTMWLPCLILAGICILFGVFAYQVPIKYFILPIVKEITFIGTWYVGLSTLLIIIGLVLGLLVFKLKWLRPALRQDTAFTGGEVLGLEENRVTGTEFYNTIKELGLLRTLYKRAEAGFFDIYEQGKRFIFSISGILQYLHNGVLPTYLVWCLLGMLVLFFWCLGSI